MARSLWGSSERRKWGVRAHAATAMVGLAPSLRKIARAAPDRKASPLDGMIRTPSSSSEATWEALLILGDDIIKYLLGKNKLWTEEIFHLVDWMEWGHI